MSSTQRYLGLKVGIHLEFVILNCVRFSGGAGGKEYRGLFPGGQDKCQVIVREGGDFLFKGEE
jgi:hypothetical protein